LPSTELCLLTKGSYGAVLLTGPIVADSNPALFADPHTCMPAGAAIKAGTVSPGGKTRTSVGVAVLAHGGIPGSVTESVA
jgi:hypothetical protein